MKICTKPDSNAPIKGHIYKALDNNMPPDFGNLAIAAEDYITKKLSLVSLLSGEQWSTTSCFGNSGVNWVDVTDKYCLKEI
jgi:hypothetical protein